MNKQKKENKKINVILPFSIIVLYLATSSVLLFNEVSGEVVEELEVLEDKTISYNMNTENFIDIWLNKSEKIEEFSTNRIKNTYMYTGPVKINASEEEQIKIRWIWDKTHDLDMILTFERESGFKNVISKYNSNGTRDYGETQLNSQYHSDFIFSPEFKDWRKRLDYGIMIYNNAKERGILNTTFYAYPVRYSVKNRFDLSNLNN